MSPRPLVYPIPYSVLVARSSLDSETGREVACAVRTTDLFMSSEESLFGFRVNSAKNLPLFIDSFSHWVTL
jgi:hypothetical protein